MYIVLDLDSLIFNVSHKDYTIDYTVKIKDKKRDSLIIIGEPNGNINYKEPFTLFGNIPFRTLDKKKITILDRDSLNVDFNYKLDTITNCISINFNKTADNSYKIKVLPEALTDFFGTKNDTLNYSLTTAMEKLYMNAFLLKMNL